jgi:plasmid stability protein
MKGRCSVADILIRGIDAEVVQRLKARAKRNGRSLQGEARLILENAAGHSLPEALAAAGQWRKKLARPGRRFTDAAALIREDRER